MNGKRSRNLTDSQKAAVAVEVLSWFEKETKERQKATQAKLGERVGLKVRAGMPTPSGRAREQAAQTIGAGPPYVEDAKWIKAERPQDFEAVKRGDKTISRVMREARRAGPGSGRGSPGGRGVEEVGRCATA